MVLPSRREGYGMIVVEAAACGTPSVVVREPDNAAVELIEEGVNGVIAASAEPAALAQAIVAVIESGRGAAGSARASGSRATRSGSRSSARSRRCSLPTGQRARGGSFRASVARCAPT